MFNKELKYFVTFTFDVSKVDLTTEDEVKTEVRKWLRDMQERKGLKYFFFEFDLFENQNGFYFHGFINDSLALRDSGTRTVYSFSKPLTVRKIEELKLEKFVKQVVYNIDDWPFGFSTAIPVNIEL